ncbi:MAG: efflux RND transporter periplasmic adaptor subunit [Acidobacteria bacterium]|nr:MAG: efflux RND transporter periplasmic adaptor subunit [Acidobacteriota bacterium]
MVQLLKRHWIIAIGVVAAIALFAAFAFKGNDKPQYFTVKADRGDIRAVVEATGTINAVITVQVGSQVSGTISHLYADFNSRVKKGQVVAQIDPALFEGALLQAKADLANAQANLAAAKANVEKAKATALQARADYQRTQGLAKEGVMSPQQLDLARANADTSDAAVSAADSGVIQAAAQVKQKEAAVTVAQTNLNYTTIHAPIDGTVIARNVDVGQTVAASLQAPTLFTIAQDLTKMQVYASTDESDVGMIKVAQPVTFKVDAFPKETFTGRVSQIRMNATTVQNVVTYNTIIDFDNPELKLFPGMTAYITIPVATARNALRVPNGALRYKPDMKAEDIRALYQKYGLARTEQARDSNEAPNAGGASGKQYRARNQGEQGGGDTTQPKTDNTQPRTPHLDVAVIWKLRPDKTLEPVRVRTGITDHTVTEVAQVLSGQLNEGDQVVTGAMTAAASSGSRPPGMGGGGAPRR